jgi:hypothetical protein
MALKIRSSDETTSHSTRQPKVGSQVAGYKPDYNQSLASVSCWLSGMASSAIRRVKRVKQASLAKAARIKIEAQHMGYM